MIYKILTGCYIVAALVLVAACNDGLDIQTKYPFTVETMPVPKELKVNETAEIRCELKREGRWEDTRYMYKPIKNVLFMELWHNLCHILTV